MGEAQGESNGGKIAEDAAAASTVGFHMLEKSREGERMIKY